MLVPRNDRRGSPGLNHTRATRLRSTSLDWRDHVVRAPKPLATLCFTVRSTAWRTASLDRRHHVAWLNSYMSTDVRTTWCPTMLSLRPYGAVGYHETTQLLYRPQLVLGLSRKITKPTSLDWYTYTCSLETWAGFVRCAFDYGTAFICLFAHALVR